MALLVLSTMACTENSTPDNPDNTNKLAAVDFTVLTINLGNTNIQGPHYPMRMKSADYEAHMAGVIQTMSPDIVVLQEVLSDKTCETFLECDPSRTCYEWWLAEPAARRLLGPNYTIVCDAREQVECMGVHLDFGSIRGIRPGEYVAQGAITPSLPLPGCNWYAGECSEDQCDQESTVSGILVDTKAGPLHLVHMHPMAQMNATVTGDSCRALQIRQVFEDNIVPGETALAPPGESALILGDWNLGLEIYKLSTLFGSALADQVWYNYINCHGCDYVDLDPRDENNKRYSTTSNFSWLGQIIAIDHVVVTRDITGTCTVHNGGGMPGTSRLDSNYPGIDTMPPNDRMDHYGISCDLHFEPFK